MPLLEQVLEKNPETVKIVHKNLPLVRIHKMAKPAAMAAHAAGEQGKFWEFHDLLYSRQNVTEASITAIAEQLQLDMERFARDRHSVSIRRHIDEDIMEARRIGVTATPTVFINGRKLKRRSVQAIQAMIDQELAK